MLIVVSPKVLKGLRKFLKNKYDMKESERTINLLKNFNKLILSIKRSDKVNPIIDHVENEPGSYSKTAESIDYLQMIFEGGTEIDEPKEKKKPRSKFYVLSEKDVARIERTFLGNIDPMGSIMKQIRDKERRSY